MDGALTDPGALRSPGFARLRAADVLGLRAILLFGALGLLLPPLPILLSRAIALRGAPAPRSAT